MIADKLTASQLLKITIPEKLFSSPDDAKKEYRKLSMLWHPDRHNGNVEVFQHVKELYEQAEKKIESNSWRSPGLERIETTDGRRFEIRYRKHHQLELGDMFITDTVVAYLIKNDFKDLVESSRKMMNFHYANDKMETEFSRYLPKIMIESQTSTHQFIVYPKTPDVLLLRDVLDHYDRKIAPEHAAWILSTLYNLNCFFKYNEISHNAISPDTYFISPKHHSGMMLGGWWYSTRVNEKLVAVPQRTLLHAPNDLLKNKISVPEIDSSLIKTTGLELIGDIFGSRLIQDKSIPKPLLNWLRTPGEKDAVKEYGIWRKKILIDSWGKPRFHDMKLNVDDLYS